MQKRKFFYVLSLVLACCAQLSFAQKNIGEEETAKLTQLEDSLVVLADSMAQAPVPDDRIDFCIRFTKNLRIALETPGSFQYPFSKLSTKIHIIYPEDKTFRIFNWLIAPSLNMRRYYGAIQMNSDEPRYYPLKDRSEDLAKEAEMAVVPSDRWYGCEYYKIMSYTLQGQPAYLLFGFNTNGATSNKKILDMLTFDNRGPVFGAPIFAVPDTKGQRLVQQSRVIFEYKKQAQMHLNYDNDKKMIVFSRLASEITDPNRKNTYIPTGQVDGLRWENDMFMFVKDAMPVLKLQDGQAPIDGVMLGGK